MGERSEMNKSNKYWEECWKQENLAELYQYLDKYNGYKSKEIEVFKEHHIAKICDAACGFGAYSLAFASNGFEVHSFDISETAVKITKSGLKKYGMVSSNVKVASILDTKYQNESFDGVVAHAVLDHLTVVDATKALEELLRITRKNGLIMISFDTAELEDYEVAHTMIEAGTMEYTEEARKGMLFHPYDWEEIDAFLKSYNLIYKVTNAKNEKIVILKK